MKKIIILAIALTMGSAVSAQEYWGQTQIMERQSRAFNQGETQTGESGVLRGSRTDGATAPTPLGVPVGGGLLCLVALGGAYALRKKRG